MKMFLVTMALGSSALLWAVSPPDALSYSSRTCRDSQAESVFQRPLKVSDNLTAELAGALVWSDSWEHPYPYGLYDFTDCNLTPCLRFPIRDNALTGVYANGNYFLVTRELNSSGMLGDITWTQYDTESGQVLHTTSIDSPAYSRLPLILTHDDSSGVTYALTYSADNNEHVLASADLNTGTLYPLGSLGSISELPTFIAMAAIGNGEIYAVATDGYLYLIDASTCSVSMISSTGLSPQYIQSAVFDRNSGCIWWAASLSSGTSKLCRVEIPSGHVTVIGDFPTNEEFVGLYVKSQITDPAAPGLITDLDFTPSYPGALSGVVGMTLPDLSVAGQPLDGIVDVTLSVDGESNYTLSGLPGSRQSVELTLSAGMHTFTATSSHETHTGSPSAVSLWVGPDTPAAVGDLHLGIFNNTQAELTWTAPAGGVHGGWCPVDEITYRIVRNDGTVCKENYERTLFSEQLPDKISTYSYTVIPCLPGSSEGAASVSNSVRGGLYYELPVSFDFNSETDFNNDIVIVDNNNDGCTWAFSYTWDAEVAEARYYCSWSEAADDYLFLPPVYLESESVYEISFEHTSGWDGLQEDLRLMGASQPSVDSVSETLADWGNITADGTTTKKAVLHVSETGILYPAFHIYSPAGQSTFGIDNVQISRLGDSRAPATPAISLQSSAADNHDDVKVSVVTSRLDLAGNTLDELKSVSIFRGNSTDPVHVFSAVAPDETLEWTDTEPGNGPVVYSVKATNSFGDSPTASAEIFVGGLLSPWSAAFATDPETEYFSVVDANSDGSTWCFKDNSAMYEYNLLNDADDWLFSPKLHLDAGRIYRIHAKVRTNQWVGQPESLDLTWGTTPSPDTQSTLVSMPELLAPDGMECNAWLAVPGSGNFNIGAHACSPKARLQIYIDELGIADVASTHSPAAPEDLNVLADKEGLLKATVSFRVPSSAYDGEPIEHIDFVEILRDGNVVFRSEEVQPNQSVTWTDNEAAAGLTRYAVRAANSYGTGIESTESVFVGHDIPAAPIDLRIVANADNSGAVLTWTAPASGVHGGYVDPTAVSYRIIRTMNYSPETISEGLVNETLVDKVGFTGPQSQISYSVTAFSDMGEGESAAADVVLGQLKNLPLEENFASYFSSEWINAVTTNYNGSWMIMDSQDGVTSVDEGSGFLQYHKWNDDEEVSRGYVLVPKVSLAGSVNPTASLWFYHLPQAASGKHLIVGYRLNDGDFTELEDLYVNAGEDGWKRHSWQLPVSDGFLALELHAETYDNLSRIFIDNISIDDIFDRNLCIDSFIGPDEIGPGGATFSVSVTNKGLLDAGTFSVSLLRDGEEAKNCSVVSLAAGESISCEFHVDGPSAPECGDSHIYSASLNYIEDEYEADNFSRDLVARFKESLYPSVKNLTAMETAGGVSLDWDKAESYLYPAVSESFEDMTPFAIENMEPWDLYDGDGQRTIGIQYGLSFSDWYTPKAWQVWDPMRVGLLGEDVMPHSGNLCLMSMSSDGTIPYHDDTTPANDDWLISEEIAGATAVSFWLKQPTDAYGNETAQILWSSENRDPESFSVLADITLSEKAVWSRHSFILPEEARYFAIRHNSAFFGLWLDDVEYSPLRNRADLFLEGYNIYRDGSLIGSSATEIYVDNDVNEGSHVYTVAARYELGEGAASLPVEIEYTAGVADLSMDSSLHRIWLEGNDIVIDPSSQCKVTITSADGTTTANFEISEKCRYRVNPGVYIVRAGSFSKKLIVK